MKDYLRKITDLLPNKGQIAYRLSSFFFLLFLILAGILLQTLVFLSGKTLVAREQYENHAKDFQYWSSVAAQYPTIPDVLYNASLSALNDNKKKEAIEYIDRALQLDPLFKKATELKNEISSRG